MMDKQFHLKRSPNRQGGQSMIEYLALVLAVIVVLLAPMPSSVPGKQASVLTQLSEALRSFYSDYSAAVSQP